jgi:two-component sensor histidine kinase
MPVRRGHRRPISFGLAQLPIGVAAGLVGVGVRYLLPLAPQQLPTLTIVVAVALTSTFVGVGAGISAATVGGLLSWYLFFAPFSWELTSESAIPLFGFSVIAAVIIITSHLYRLSEQRNHEAQLAALQKQSEAAELFAREMAHRLKNALAIVQSVAFQTLGEETASSAKFGGRLKVLADAHDLLSEHVERPSADVADVIHLALRSAEAGADRVRLESAQGRIAAREVVSLALALHELFANACEHGALSDGRGAVLLRAEELGDRIKIAWKEEGGPTVPQPIRSGFGTAFLRRLGTERELQFEPDGFRFTVCLRKA